MRKQSVLILALMVAAGLPMPLSASVSAYTERDYELKVMLRFIREHRQVASTLEVIDIKGRAIIFDGGCRAQFKRDASNVPRHSRGPIPLVFASSNCPIEGLTPAN